MIKTVNTNIFLVNHKGASKYAFFPSFLHYIVYNRARFRSELQIFRFLNCNSVGPPPFFSSFSYHSINLQCATISYEDYLKS